MDPQAQPGGAGPEPAGERDPVRRPPQHPELLAVHLEHGDLAHRGFEQGAVAAAPAGVRHGPAGAEVEHERPAGGVLVEGHGRLQQQGTQVGGVLAGQEVRQGHGARRLSGPGGRPRAVERNRLGLRGAGLRRAVRGVGRGRSAVRRRQRLVRGQQQDCLVGVQHEPSPGRGQGAEAGLGGVVEGERAARIARRHLDLAPPRPRVGEQVQVAVGEPAVHRAHLAAVPAQEQRRGVGASQRGRERVLPAGGLRRHFPVGAPVLRVAAAPCADHREGRVIAQARVVAVLLGQGELLPVRVGRGVHGEHAAARGAHPVQPAPRLRRQPAHARQHDHGIGRGVERGEGVVVEQVEVVARAADRGGQLLADVGAAGGPQVVAAAAGGAHIGVGQVQRHLGARRAQAQRGAQAGEMCGELRHRGPPGVAVIQRARGVEGPAQARCVGRGVRPAVAHEVRDAQQQMLMRLPQQIQRRGAEGG